MKNIENMHLFSIIDCMSITGSRCRVDFGRNEECRQFLVQSLAFFMIKYKFRCIYNKYFEVFFQAPHTFRTYIVQFSVYTSPINTQEIALFYAHICFYIKHVKYLFLLKYK